MKKVYQKIISSENGDCLRATVASLFEMELEDVPHFITLENRHEALVKFFEEKGYYIGMDLFNRNYSRLCNPKYRLCEKEKFHEPSMLSSGKLRKLGGVDGLFLATVFSPRYFNLYDGFNYTHSVICDVNFNIVHDPNPEYKELKRYPLQELLGKNGIIMVDKITKK